MSHLWQILASELPGGRPGLYVESGFGEIGTLPKLHRRLDGSMPPLGVGIGAGAGVGGAASRAFGAEVRALLPRII